MHLSRACGARPFIPFMPTNIKKIGVLTGGGDAPGLNAVIRAVVKTGSNAGLEVLGVEDSFDGLLEFSRTRLLTPKDVTGILRQGGTILGTINTGDPFVRSVTTTGGRHLKYADRVVEMFHAMGLGGLIVIGGDGTLGLAHRFTELGIPIIGVPKTIDNDIFGTTNCFGFDTAVQFATDAIDRLHTTAEAHRRIIVVEVMGRYAGWIALYAGVGGGADAVLIPEIPYDIERVAQTIRARDALGAHFSIVVVAEGAKPGDGGISVVEQAGLGKAERLGGAGQRVAHALAELTGKETRTVVLGHLQRGGSPTAFDRVLATRFGAKAVELLLAGEQDKMVAYHHPAIVAVPLGDVVGQTRNVPPDSDVVQTARGLGISFGD
jgi:ATP-dependent phosphofructokinase / diphosphate-dependent phosphofructokinase